MTNESTQLSFEFQLKTNLKAGSGVARNLWRWLKELSFKKVGIIIDAGVINTSYAQEIITDAEKENFEYIKKWIYDLQREPDYETLDQIKLLFLNEDQKPTVDCFIGIGGGSVLDFSKGLATVVVNPGPAINYRGFPVNINKPLPVVALPTTAGTGSEVTYNAVFIDRQNKKKLGINTVHNFPVLAILDPLLTISCPRQVTVSSGMDALVHTLESYVATKANALTRLFAKEALKLLFNNLPKIISNPDDIDLRAYVQYGAYIAAISLMNAGSGPAGALSYPLGAHFNVPHGLAGAFFIPHIVKYNVKAGYDYSELYDLIENMDYSDNWKIKSQKFSNQLFALCDKLEIPKSLKIFGVNQDNLQILLEETKNLEKAFAQNPVPFSVENGQKLLQKLM